METSKRGITALMEREHRLTNFSDIVDTKNGDDHVSDILLGSISRKADATERGSTPVTGAVHLE